MTVRRTLLQATAVLGLSAFLAGGVLLAQEAAPGAAKPAKQGRKQGARGQRQPAYIKAVNALNLTDEQKPKVKAVTDKYQADMKAMRGQGADKKPDQAKMREMNKKMRADVEAILTAEQKAQLKQATAKNQNGGKGGKQGGNAGGAAPAPNANP